MLWGKEDDFDLPAPRPLDTMINDSDRDKRKFKDIPCIFIFFLVMAFCTTVIAIALTYGDPSTLVLPSLEIVQDEFTEFTLREITILHHDLKAILSALVAAMIVAFIWFQLFKHLTQWMVYTILAAAILSLTLLGVYLYSVSQRMDSFEFILLAIVLWIAALGILIVGYVLRDKIAFTAAIIKEAGKALQANPNVLAVVGITFLIYAVLISLWIASFIYLYTVPNGVSLFSTKNTWELVHFFNHNYHILFWLLFVGGCWVLPMLWAIEQYIVSSIITQHLEMVSGARTRRRNITMIATKEAFSTSFGSLALGSSLVGIAYFVSIFTKYITSKQETPWKNNAVVKLSIRFATFLVEVVSEFAYIYIALTGDSFVTSSKKVVTLIRTELAQIIVTEVIISYLLLLGQIIGTVLVTFLTIWIVDLKHLHVGIISVVVVAGSTFFLFAIVSKAILSSVHTLLIFVLQDLQAHGGVGDHEYKSPESIRNIILSKLVDNKN